MSKLSKKALVEMNMERLLYLLSHNHAYYAKTGSKMRQDNINNIEEEIIRRDKIRVDFLSVPVEQMKAPVSIDMETERENERMSERILARLHAPALKGHRIEIIDTDGELLQRCGCNREAGFLLIIEDKDLHLCATCIGVLGKQIIDALV